MQGRASEVRLAKIDYTKDGRTSTRYVLICEPIGGGDNWAGLDITRSINEDIKADRAAGFNGDGREFAFAVMQALEAGRAHSDVMERWKRSGDSESNRPIIGLDGIWKVFRKDSTTFIQEWK